MYFKLQCPHFCISYHTQFLYRQKNIGNNNCLLIHVLYTQLFSFCFTTDSSERVVTRYRSKLLKYTCFPCFLYHIYVLSYVLSKKVFQNLFSVSRLGCKVHLNCLSSHLLSRQNCFYYSLWSGNSEIKQRYLYTDNKQLVLQDYSFTWKIGQGKWLGWTFFCCIFFPLVSLLTGKFNDWALV